MIIVSAPFDPITQEELDQIKKIHRENVGQEIYIYVEEEGILSRHERIALVKKACKPYRHLHWLSKSTEETICLDVSKEELVRQGYFRYAAQGIRNILIQKGHYLDEIVDANCKPQRAIHSRGVAETCVELAHAHHLDEIQASHAGYLHDITKKMDEEEAKKIISIYKSEWLEISPKVWHSYTAVIWLKQNMYFYDTKILRAIEHHTLGDGKSDLDAILYIADKTEPNRNYDSTKERTLSKKSLKEGANLVKEESKQYIYEKEGIHV